MGKCKLGLGSLNRYERPRMKGASGTSGYDLLVKDKGAEIRSLHQIGNTLYWFARYREETIVMVISLEWSFLVN